MIIEDIASEIGRHLLIPDSYINQHIERKPSVLSLINVIERCIVEPSIAAQRLITDIFDFDSGLSYWVNCCVVIEDDTGSREIIGELPIDIPFLTQNDKLDKIVSLSPDFFDIQYGDYSNQKLSLIIAKPSP